MAFFVLVFPLRNDSLCQGFVLNGKFSDEVLNTLITNSAMIMSNAELGVGSSVDKFCDNGGSRTEPGVGVDRTSKSVRLLFVSLPA